MRSAADIDLSKAKPGHARCNGTGIVAYKTYKDPTKKDGQLIRIPIICRCVTRRGGVKADALDKMALELQRQLKEGIFGKQLAADIRNLPAEARLLKVAELQRRIEEPDIDPEQKKQIGEALEILNQEEA